MSAPTAPHSSMSSSGGGIASIFGPYSAQIAFDFREELAEPAVLVTAAGGQSHAGEKNGKRAGRHRGKSLVSGR